MTTLLVFCLGYVWGKEVQHRGSWTLAAKAITAAVTKVVREFWSGLSLNRKGNNN